MLAPAATAELSKGHRPLTRRHLAIAAVCSIGMFFDAFELSMSTAFGAVFAPAYGGAADQLALLIVAGPIGGAIGSPILGYMADRSGRRRALTVSLAGFGLLSIVCAQMSSLASLTMARFVASLFIGAYQPLVTTYLVEIIPSGRSARVILWTSVLAGFGAASVLFLSGLLSRIPGFPVDGWRGALYFGGAGGLAVAAAAWRILPESPGWLRAAGRVAEADVIMLELTIQTPAAAGGLSQRPTAVLARVRWGDLFRRHYATRLILFVVLEFLVVCGLGFTILEGAIFAARGNNQSTSLLFAGFATLGVPAGSLLTSFIGDRIRRPVLIAILAGLLAVCAMAFVLVSDPVGGVVISGIFNLLIGCYAVLVLMFGAELFPARIRGRAATFGHTANRLSLAIVPLIGLRLIHGIGDWAFLALIGASQLLMAVTMLSVGRRIYAIDRHDG